MCIPQDKFEISDEIEGSADEWTSIMFYAEDVSCLLTYGKEIVGYASMYPVKDTAYEELINGKKIMRPDMVDLYAFGGEFDIYIPMLPVPQYRSSTLMLYSFIFSFIILYISSVPSWFI